IAFKVLDPVLRSRGKITDEAKRLCSSNEFAAEMRRLFEGGSSGEMQILTLNHAFERLQALEQRIAKLERPHE
ncbi:MAG TPA: hypothetical protein VHK27_15340, partial [Gammaproteobacteria bacterium]|nr:hypothetical protein [Gammaproteobacteria bacterium]